MKTIASENNGDGVDNAATIADSRSLQVLPKGGLVYSIPPEYDDLARELKLPTLNSVSISFASLKLYSLFPLQLFFEDLLT